MPTACLGVWAMYDTSVGKLKQSELVGAWFGLWYCLEISPAQGVHFRYLGSSRRAPTKNRRPPQNQKMISGRKTPCCAWVQCVLAARMVGKICGYNADTGTDTEIYDDHRLTSFELLRRKGISDKSPPFSPIGALSNRYRVTVCVR